MAELLATLRKKNKYIKQKITKQENYIEKVQQTKEYEEYQVKTRLSQLNACYDELLSNHENMFNELVDEDDEEISKIDKEFEEMEARYFNCQSILQQMLKETDDSISTHSETKHQTPEVIIFPKSQEVKSIDKEHDKIYNTFQSVDIDKEIEEHQIDNAAIANTERFWERNTTQQRSQSTSNQQNIMNNQSLLPSREQNYLNYLKSQNNDNPFMQFPSFQTNTIPQHNFDANQNYRAQSQRQADIYDSPRLPSISLPSFDGSLDKWLQFRDTFKALVINNPRAKDDVTKLNHLIGCLKDEALKIIDRIELSERGFNLAWTTLCNRYDNTRIIIDKHVSELFKIKAINFESSTELRRLVDDFGIHLRALKSLEVPVQHWDLIIIHLISNRLDVETRKLFETFAAGDKTISWEETITFLDKRSRILESVELNQKVNYQNNSNFKSRSYKQNNNNYNKVLLSSNNYIKCFQCSAEHELFHCKDFLKMSVVKRYEVVKSHNLCFNCLRKGHSAQVCHYGKCKICYHKHNTLLHMQNKNDTQNNREQSNNQYFKENNNVRSQENNNCTQSDCNNENSKPKIILCNSNTMQLSTQQIILATAVVKVIDHNGNTHFLRALLDSASHSNFICNRVVQLLKLKTQTISYPVTGLNEVKIFINQKVSVKVSSRLNIDYQQEVQFLVVPQVTGDLPLNKVSTSNWKIPENIQLADPKLHIPARIDLLLGAEVFAEILLSGQLKLGVNMPILQETLLGWIATGKCQSDKTSRSTSYCNLSINHNIDVQNQLQQFWELEKCESNKKYFTEEEKYCETLFKETTKRDATGRYIVALPLKDNAKLLADNKYNATKRLKYLQVKLNKNETIKTLGLYWETKQDIFLYKVKEIDQHVAITKRFVLSEIAKLYDPLGLLSPIIVLAKIIMQEIWKENIDWDSNLSDSLRKNWLQFSQKLNDINDIKIDRFVCLVDATHIEIHGFADASIKAYGACVYIRCIDAEGHCKVQLLCSKSKVAPVKATTLPRLELLAAHLLSLLIVKVNNAMQMSFNKITLWSDSTITLAWIATATHKLKTFVANRVAEIQELTSTCVWQHIKSEYNPADIISRGMLPKELQDSKMWWFGPEFLSQKEIIYTELKYDNRDLPECKITLVNIDDKDDFMIKYSSFKKLIRIMAYMKRFIINSKKRLKSQDNATQVNNNNQVKLVIPSLTATELLEATKHLVKIVQYKLFKTEIKQLKINKFVHNTSSLKCLNPFLDKDEILRVGGRISNSIFTYEQKHPMLLPRNHHFVKILVESTHIDHGHAGQQALISILKEQYWIVRCKDIVRQITRKCITCFKIKPQQQEQFMGELPPSRVQYISPFENTGVDYCGPFYVRPGGPRSKVINKAYVAIFVCMGTKAVHVEVVSNMTSQAFIAALYRFISRRNKPKTIFSDNGKNFVGANNELQDLMKLLHDEEHKKLTFETCAQNRIQWNFIPPRAPHFGGLWEAAVKSFKYHFKRIIGSTILTFEELSTVSCRIESMLNSRPLTQESTDPNDLNALTPAHFLLCKSISTIVEKDVKDVAVNRLQRWQMLQQFVQHLWKRWSSEYLITLQRRSKNYNKILSVHPNMMVLIRDDDTAPMNWPLGRITKVFPGSDEELFQ